MEKIHIHTFCDIIDAELIVRRYPNQQDRWTAQIDHSQIKEDMMLISAYGDGTTPREALSAYLDQIRGKLLIIHAFDEKLRREYHVPENICSD